MPHIHRWDIPNPKLLVHILHGMAEHGGRYQRLAKALNAHDIAVWAHDHRGHGHTAPILGHFADTNGWRLVVDDAWNVSQKMKATYPDVPLALFAHSMGSFIGQALLAERGTEYVAVVLSGTNGPPGLGEAILRFCSHFHLKKPRDPGVWFDERLIERFCYEFRPIVTKFDWISGDPTEVALYASDCYCGFPLSYQAWFDFLHGKADLGSREHVDKIPKSLPIRLIAGSRDPVGDETRGVRRLAERYRNRGLTVSEQYYRKGRHELVNEIPKIRDKVTADLIAWLKPFQRR